VLKHLAKEVKVVPTSSGAGGRDSTAPLVECGESSLTENLCLSDQLKRLSFSRVCPGGSSGREMPIRADHDSLLPLDYDVSNLPPPPEYRKWMGLSSPLTVMQRHKMILHSSITPEKLSLSRSQPDLSRIGTGKVVTDVIGCRGIATSPR
jgi:hypothetical protein